MPRFVGRARELERLRELATRVRASGEGVLLTIRGRRQVGKSTLVEQFLQRMQLPNVFFAASFGTDPAAQRAALVSEIAGSTLAAAPVVRDASFTTWEALLAALAAEIDEPSVLVIDEFPWLLTADGTVEGALHAAWDRRLSRRPVLLILLGSDLGMMAQLGTYGRPLFGRAREMVLDPLTPHDLADLLDLPPVTALEAHLVTGGFPRIAQEWRHERTPLTFVRRQLRDSTSPLVVVGERVLNTEFPAGLQAREVLLTVGGGEAAFSRIRDRAGLNEGALARTLRTLTDDKRVLVAQRPLSARRGTAVRYLVADAYLRFWLRFVAPGLEQILRGRGDHTADLIADQWPDWRGRAIEPLVREALARMLPDARFGAAQHVGAYWTRTGDVEVDLVGADSATAPAQVQFVGSVKWRERAPFGRKDLRALAVVADQVPGGAGTHLVGVSRSGFATDELDVAVTPEQLLTAWQPPVTD